MKWIKYSIILFLLLIIIVLFRTWQFSSRSTDKIESANSSVSPINYEAAIHHFAKALTYKTISSESTSDNYGEDFNKFHVFLKLSFPNVFSKLNITKIGQHALLMKWQGSDKSLQPALLMAHQDVVPIAPGTEAAWHHDPFKGEIKDGYVWGRGALDDKASLIAIFEAANTLLGKNFVPKRTIYFYFGDNEENAGQSAIKASKLLEKQGVHFAYVLDEGSSIADGLIPHVEGLAAFIGVTEKGFLNLEFNAITTGGHSSMPPKEMAIAEVSKAIVSAVKNPFPAHMDNVISQMYDGLLPEMPWRYRIVMANKWLFSPFIMNQLSQEPLTSALVRTTQAPTIFNAGIKSNVLPVQAKAVLNLRIMPGETVESATEHVRHSVKDTMVKVQKMSEQNNPSPVSSTDSDEYHLLSNLTRQLYGPDIPVVPYVLEGATDSRYFVPIADNVYRYVPITLNKDDLVRYHGIDERLAEHDYLRLTGFYYALISAT